MPLNTSPLDSVVVSPAALIWIRVITFASILILNPSEDGDCDCGGGTDLKYAIMSLT